jgi:hypothetical protein
LAAEVKFRCQFLVSRSIRLTHSLYVCMFTGLHVRWAIAYLSRLRFDFSFDPSLLLRFQLQFVYDWSVYHASSDRSGFHVPIMKVRIIICQHWTSLYAMMCMILNCSTCWYTTVSNIVSTHYCCSSLYPFCMFHGNNAIKHKKRSRLPECFLSICNCRLIWTVCT